MYDYRKLQELGWFVGVAVATAIFQSLISFSPTDDTNWRIWATSLFAAAVRAAAGAGLAWLGRIAAERPNGPALRGGEPAPSEPALTAPSPESP